MPAPTTSSMKTKVKNLTSSPLYVFFFPPHGRTLTANEERELPFSGGIDAILTSGRFSSQRKTSDLIDEMILDKKIAIIPPAPQVKDVTTGIIRDVIATSGTLSAPVSSVESLPAPPSAVTLGTTTTTTQPLTWTPPTDVGTRPIIGYTIEYKLNSEPTTWSTLAVNSASAVGGTVTGLTDNTAYNFRVKTRTNVGSSAASNQVNATTVDAP